MIGFLIKCLLASFIAFIATAEKLPIWLNENKDEVRSESVNEDGGAHGSALICPFTELRKAKEYNPESGCALLSTGVPRFLRKNSFSSTLVICATKPTISTSGIILDEKDLVRLGMVVHGRSLIAYIYPGPDTSVSFMEDNIIMNSTARLANIKSITFKSSASNALRNCSDLRPIL